MHMCMWPRTPSTTSGSPRAERIAHTQSNASHARLALRRTLHLHPSLCNTSSPVLAGQPSSSARGSAHPSQQSLPLRPAQLRGFAPTEGRSWEPCSSPCSPLLPAPRSLSSSSTPLAYCAAPSRADRLEQPAGRSDSPLQRTASSRSSNCACSASSTATHSSAISRSVRSLQRPNFLASTPTLLSPLPSAALFSFSLSHSSVSCSPPASRRSSLRLIPIILCE